MSKTKYGYEDFRFDDITGGINTRDYPSEIENKQSLSLENWNFNGNRLVSEKGWTDSGNANTAEIGGLTIDSGDIWTVAEGVIYENGNAIVDGTGILVTTNKDTFQSGVKFYITIEGIDYAISGETVKDFITNLQTSVEDNGLETVYQEDLLLIRKANGSSIDYTVETNQAYVIYNNFDFSNDPYVYWTDYRVGININGTKYSFVYSMSSEFLNQGEVDIEIMTELFNLIPSSIDKELIFLDSSFNKTDDYEKYSAILINNSSSIEVSSETVYEYRLNGFSGDDFIYKTGYSIEGVELRGVSLHKTFGFPGNSIDYTGTTATINGTVISLSGTLSRDQATESWRDQLESIGLTTHIQNYGATSTVFYYIANTSNEYGLDVSIANENYPSGTFYYNNNSNNAIEMGTTLELVNNATGLGFEIPENYNIISIQNKLNLIPGINSIIETRNGTEAIWFYKGDYEEINITELFTTQVYSTDESREGEDIRFHTYDEVVPSVTPLEVGDGLSGRANITIGNLGNLIVDKDDGGAFYAYDGLNIKIGEDSIGEPTVGTIYNGKIILGGYEDNDNIIFSKTSSPTFPLNILNFTDYSAGGQSVSGGDKGIITGMSVGENGLYVFKDNSVWYSNSESDNSDSLSFNLIFNKITSNGALNQNVITEVDQETFYLDWNNRAVRRLGYEQNLTTLRDSSISREIASLFKDLPEDQSLATSHFKYPNYQLSLTDGTGSKITYNNGNSYYLNNKHFIYNVENKSWTTKTGISDMIASHRGFFASSDGYVYEDFVGNTLEDGTHISKELTFIDDVDYKRHGEFEVVGDITGDGGEKKLEIQICIDENELDIGRDDESTKRIITASDGQTIRFRERVDLFDDGQRFIFKLNHSGNGYVEVSDVNIKVKPIDVFHSNYY